MSNRKHAASFSQSEATIAELRADRGFALEDLKPAQAELDRSAFENIVTTPDELFKGDVHPEDFGMFISACQVLDRFHPKRLRSTVLVVATLLMSSATYAQYDWQQVATVESEYLSPNDRECSSDARPAIVGIRHDHMVLACVDLDTTRFDQGPRQISKGVGGALPSNQWPSTAPPELQLSYSGPSLHWCGPGKFMVGYKPTPRNEFTCRSLRLKPGVRGAQPLTVLALDGSPRFVRAPGSFTILQYVDSRRGREDLMHACPDGYILVGMHLDANIFLCGKVSP